ncbi:tyrosine-type recombinase/integrase [Pseudomonas argentinensis]|nr:tyrosine-type recombinase/integrase [Pseudomonas argentinensis]
MIPVQIKFSISYKIANLSLHSRLDFVQATHVLRHTFASHFVINGGNILTLQKILGHQSLTMTMRYAHLAPNHLQDAINLGPPRPNLEPQIRY